MSLFSVIPGRPHYKSSVLMRPPSPKKGNETVVKFSYNVPCIHTGKVKVQLYPLLTSTLDKDERKTTRPGRLTPGKYQGSYWTGGRVNLTAGLNVFRKRKISYNYRDSNPRPSILWRSYSTGSFHIMFLSFGKILITGHEVIRYCFGIKKLRCGVER
jgi:hypothetical protein